MCVVLCPRCHTADIEPLQSTDESNQNQILELKQQLEHQQKREIRSLIECEQRIRSLTNKQKKKDCDRIYNHYKHSQRNIERELQDQRDRIEAQEKDKQTAALSAVKQQMNEQIEELKNEKEEMQSVIVLQSQTVQALHEKVDDIEIRCRSLELESQGKDQIIASLSAVKQEMTGQIEELQKEQERTESAIATMTQKNQQQSDQIQQLQDALNEMENAKSRVESLVENLHSQIVKLENENQMILAERDAKREQVIRLHKKMEIELLYLEEVTRNNTNNQMENEWSSMMWTNDQLVMMRNHSETLVNAQRVRITELMSNNTECHKEWQTNYDQLMVVGSFGCFGGLVLVAIVIVLGIIGCRLRREKARMAAEMRTSRMEKTSFGGERETAQNSTRHTWPMISEAESAERAESGEAATEGDDKGDHLLGLI